MSSTDTKIEGIHNNVVRPARHRGSRKYWMVLDIEKAGDDLDSDIVGGCILVGDSDGNLCQDPCIWGVKSTKDRIEPRCAQEFWCNNWHVWNYLQSIADPPSEAWANVAHYVDQVHSTIPLDQVVSDNPAYDVGHVDYQLKIHRARQLGIRYGCKGEYHSISDPSEQCKGLPAFVQQWVGDKVKQYRAAQPELQKLTPHHPLFDAIGIYAQMVYVYRYRKGQLSCTDYLELAKYAGKSLIPARVQAFFTPQKK